MNAGVIELFGRSLLERYCLRSSFHTFMDCSGQMSKLPGEPIKRRNNRYGQVAGDDHALGTKPCRYIISNGSHGQIQYGYH